MLERLLDCLERFSGQVSWLAAITARTWLLKDVNVGSVQASCLRRNETPAQHRQDSLRNISVKDVTTVLPIQVLCKSQALAGLFCLAAYAFQDWIRRVSIVSIWFLVRNMS